jgi:hypothetical protein
MPLDTSIAAYSRAWNEQRHADCARIVKALWPRGSVERPQPITDETQFDYDQERQHGWALSKQFLQP